MTSDLALRARRANGLPVEASAPGPRSGSRAARWASAILRSPWTWVLLGSTLIFAACLAWMYLSLTTPTQVRGGEIPGLNWSAIRRSLGLALPTLCVWVVLFVWIDRYRPLRPALWYLALAWGGTVSTASSMVINTWAGQEMAIVGNGDPATGARAAVFVAPFVEEATKATVVFFIAMALRYHIVSRLQAASLAGLSAAGFAYVENVLYYSRAIVYSSSNIGAGNPEDALRQIVFLRGVLTAFGHPLFTSLTAIGFIIGLRAHSKVVRILAPVAGYLAAALGHMVFNFFASVGGDPVYMSLFGWVAMATVVYYLVRRMFAEGRRHRDRLADYVAMGWLPPSAPDAFSRQRTRWAAALISLTYGRRAFLATLRLQRSMSELVYLRDAQVRGLVDEAGTDRARELIVSARALASIAITDPRTQKIQLPKIPRFWRSWRRRPQPPSVGWAPYPGSPGQQGVGVGAPAGQGPVGSPLHSPVDPQWGPPKGP